MSFLLTAQKSARLPRETIPSYVFRFCALVERQRFTNPPEGPPTLQYKARGMSVWIVMHTFTLLSTVAWSNVSGKCACPSVLCRCLSYSCIRSALSGVCTHLLHSEVLEDFSGKCLPYASAHRFRRTTAVQYFLELAPPPPSLKSPYPSPFESNWNLESCGKQRLWGSISLLFFIQSTYYIWFTSYKHHFINIVVLILSPPQEQNKPKQRKKDKKLNKQLSYHGAILEVMKEVWHSLPRRNG